MQPTDRPRHMSLGLFLAALVLGTTAIALLSAPAQTAYALPKRPEDVPTPTPPVKAGGGGIELSVTGAVGAIHAVVQWQDGLGGWHDVDSWRGQVEESHVLWFVSEKDFGAGPFRWVVYNDDGTLSTSESFNLPANKGVVVRIQVQVAHGVAS